MAHTVVSLGDVVADLVAPIQRLPVEPEAHQGLLGPLRLEPGGAGNFLIAGARLGMHMVALGCVGDDLFGPPVLEILAQEGVQVDTMVVQQEGSTTTVIVLVDPQARHVYLGTFGTGPELALPAHWQATAAGADALFVSGFVLSERRLTRAALALLARPDLRAPVFFDPGPDLARVAPAEREALLRSCQVLILTQEEVGAFADGDTRLEAAAALRAQGPRWVCVKRGSQGAVLFTEDETLEHPGFPVPVRDPTAAGDTFAAAFVHGYLRGWEPAAILAFANAAGAAKVQKLGSGRQVPTAEEIRAVLARFHVRLPF